MEKEAKFESPLFFCFKLWFCSFERIKVAILNIIWENICTDKKTPKVLKSVPIIKIQKQMQYGSVIV